MSADRVRIRPLRDGETEPVLAVFDGLGARSRELRFMSPKLRLTPTDLCHLTHVDGVDRVALVAELPDGRPIGIARFVRHACDRAAADVAVAVVDSWQRRGIGAQLAGALATWAHRVAVRRFTIDMLRDNHGAVRLMRHSGGDVRPVGLDDHSAEFELALPSSAAREIEVDDAKLASLT
jgi:GNAT superfamily N-acetyltransferase